MSTRARQDEILRLLNEQGYVTVKYLTARLHYSSATINRDLNALQNRQLCVRSHGGVELSRAQYVPIFFRSHQMRAEKLAIGRAAASFVKDGDMIFIDGSTTAQCMGQYLIRRRDLTVVTNNIVLAANLSAQGVRVICLGGSVVEAPSMLGGEEAVENARRYKVDKMFFSTCAMSSGGLIASGIYAMMLKAVAQNAGEIFYLVDHKKIDQPFHTVYGDLRDVDYLISDHVFPDALKQAYPRTRFVIAEEAGKVDRVRETEEIHG